MVLPGLFVWSLNSDESQLLHTNMLSLNSIFYEDVNREEGEQQGWSEIKET